MVGYLEMSCLDHPEDLRDEELQLELSSFGTDPNHKVPTYYFRMVYASTGEELGHIRLRVHSNRHVELYAGHVGYEVYEPHRGHRYASRSIVLLRLLALEHGINPLWITCSPDNAASRRTLEIVGAQFIEIVDVPEDCVIRRWGIVQMCRYKLDTSAKSP